MNRYVVIVPEEDDEYRTTYPIETELTRDDLQQEAKAFFYEVTDIDYEYDYKRFFHKLDLGGTGLIIEYAAVCSEDCDRYRPLQILTVDEWFSAAN